MITLTKAEQFLTTYRHYHLPAQAAKLYDIVFLAQKYMVGFNCEAASDKDEKILIKLDHRESFSYHLASLVKRCYTDLFSPELCLEPTAQAIVKEGYTNLHQLLNLFAEVLRHNNMTCKELDGLSQRTSYFLASIGFRKPKKRCEMSFCLRIRSVFSNTLQRTAAVVRAIKGVCKRHPQTVASASTYVVYHVVQDKVFKSFNSHQESEATEGSSMYLALGAFAIGSVALIILNKHYTVQSVKERAEEEELNEHQVAQIKASLHPILVKIQRPDMLIKFMQHKQPNAPTSARIDPEGLHIGGVSYSVNIISVQRNGYNQFELIRALGRLVHQDLELNEKLSKHSGYLISSYLFWQLPFPIAPLIMNIIFKPLIELTPYYPNKRKIMETIPLLARVFPYYSSPGLIKMIISFISIYQSVSRHGYVEEEYLADQFAAQHLSVEELHAAIQKLARAHDCDQRDKKLLFQKVIMGMFGISFSYFPHRLRTKQILDLAFQQKKSKPFHPKVTKYVLKPVRVCPQSEIV